MSDAERYANEIVETLESLERLSDVDLSDPEELDRLTVADREYLSGLIDADRVTDPDELADVYDEWESTEGGGPLRAYLDSVLEVKLIGERGVGGEWTVTAVRVAVTLGGPNAWIETTSDDRVVEVTVAWGTERVRRIVVMPTVAARLWELSEM